MQAELLLPSLQPVTSDLVIARHPALVQHEEAAREGLILPPRMGGGAFQTWETLINAYQVSGTSTGTEYKESTTLTDVSPGANVSGQALTIPAGFLVAGNIIRYTAKGWFSTTAKPTIEVGLYFGGVAGKALATAKLETPETVTELPWVLEATTRIVKAEEKGKAITQGLLFGLVTPKGTEKVSITASHLPETKPQTEVEINTATANVLTMGAKWGTSNAANKFQVVQWLVEILN